MIEAFLKWIHAILLALSQRAWNVFALDALHTNAGKGRRHRVLIHIRHADSFDAFLPY